MDEFGAKLKHRQLTSKIIRVFFDVYNELGFGFLESVYGAAMGIALTAEGLQVDHQFPTPVWFRSQVIGDFRVDLLVEKVVMVELKAVRAFDPAHEAQLLHYLRATDIEVGLLMNFGPRPEFRRLAFDNQRKKIRAYPRPSAAK